VKCTYQLHYILHDCPPVTQNTIFPNNIKFVDSTITTKNKQTKKTNKQNKQTKQTHKQTNEQKTQEQNRPKLSMLISMYN